MDPDSSPYIIPKNSLRNPFPHCLLRTRLERERARERERDIKQWGSPSGRGVSQTPHALQQKKKRERERSVCVCVCA